jgi:D-alanyl-D-alanine carboxypeptidase (penicillin-binding protein 5/6)
VRRRALILAAALLAALALAAPAALAAGPSLRAKAAIVVQPDTGDVVYAHDADQRLPIASTTKLMTALLTLERSNLDDVVAAAPYSPAPAESVINLRTGERLTVRDLLRGLLLASANDAAETLAAHVAGSQAAFVREMNARAAQLHLRNTHYANAIGLDEAGNYSTARDLVTLAQVLLRKPFFAVTVDRKRATLTSGSHVRHIVNRNSLVREFPFVDGVKTGHTLQAGYVLVGAAERHGVRLVSAVLGDPSENARDSDTLALLRYGFPRYRSVLAVHRGQVLARPALKDRGGHADLIAARALTEVVRAGERPAVRVTGVPGQLDGPLAAGARVGEVVLMRRGRAIARTPLVTAAPVAQASLADRLGHFLGSAVVLLLLAVVVVSTLQLALMRRRATRRRRARSRRRGTEAA